MDKARLRKKYKEKRAQLSPELRDDYSLEIANRALELPIWDQEYYHLFLPIKRLLEIDTAYLLSILNGKDKKVVVSKSDFTTHSMQHSLLLDDTRLRENSYGIPEPETGIAIAATAIDVVFLPLLTFDAYGNRVGYGKGFYDRMLRECRPDVIPIGLSYFEAETSLIPTNDTDIPMKYCITPTRCYKF